MNNWRQQKLGNVANIKLSNIDKITKENERKIRLCNYTDVYKNSFINIDKSQNFMVASCTENEYEKFILKRDQVAITKDSETPDDIGVSTYISEDFQDVVLGYHLSLITPNKDELNGTFLHYWLNTKQSKRYFENNAGGSGQRCTLTVDCIKSIPLHLPTLQIQKSISKVLYDLDIKIELNNKINHELEAMAKTLYYYWFVQFEFSNEQGKPYKSSGGKMIYNKELMTEIPEGWEVKRLSNCVDQIIDHRGKTPKKLGSDWVIDKNGIIALSAKIVKDGKLINLDQANKVSRELYNKWMPMKLQDGDILMTSEAPAGEFYFIQGFTEYCLSQRLFALRANKSIVLPSYFYYELAKGHGYSQIQGSLSGSTVFGIRQDVLRTIKVVVPDLSIQKKFDSIIMPQLKQIKLLESQNQQLLEIRDWLLPMLMNGQVTVDLTEEKR